MPVGCLVGLLALLVGGTMAASASAQGPSASPSIIGGRGASITELPSLAFVLTERDDVIGTCTGTVVAPRVVLTAAHCLIDFEREQIHPAESFAVVTGEDNLNEVESTNVTGVTETLIYPRMNLATLHGDAGLLILAKATTAPPIAMAGVADLSSQGPGAPGWIAGWGRTNGAVNSIPAQLQVATTTVQRASYCRQKTLRFYPSFSAARQLCTVEPPSFATSTCKGDSGGPLIGVRSDDTAVQIGITSLGDPDCNSRLPSVYTRVDLVSSWVSSWIAAVEFGAPAPSNSPPRVRLPMLGIGQAKRLVAVGLGEDFRHRYRSGYSRRANCIRVERSKVKCAVAWLQGRNEYWGTITVYLAIEDNTIVWDDRYTIRWVNYDCWWYSGHRGNCAVGVKRR